MKRIVIDLDNLDNGAFKQLDDLIASLDKLNVEVAKEGAKHAQQLYNTYSDKNSSPIKVTHSADKDGSARITATGESVAFAEWGVGTNAKGDANAPIPVGNDTWSSVYGVGMYHKLGFWYYGEGSNRTSYYGKYGEKPTPTYALNNTIGYLSEQLPNIAERVFK